MLMNIKFFVDINQLEVVRSGYLSGEAVAPDLRRWRSEGDIKVDDFVWVVKGPRAGQQGIITRLLEDYRAEVCVTADHSDLSFKPESADDDIAVSSEQLNDLQLNAEKFEIFIPDLHISDRVEMYDTVQVRSGNQKLTGIVRSKRPYGYIHIADTFGPNDKASLHSISTLKPNSLFLAIYECLSRIRLDCRPNW